MSGWVLTLLIVAGVGVVALGAWYGIRSARRKDAPDDVYPMW